MRTSGRIMSLKHLAVIFSLAICVSAKSFTLVIDTTYSMENEINNIRRHIRPLINSIGNTTSIENYVLVPFNDPGVGPVLTFTKADSFINSVQSLTVSGGHDIPENSLSGLEKALQESRPESDIFLFTDACAKDEAKFNNIQTLCRITRSKVIVFMSGTCPYAERHSVGNVETYYHVTKVCFGNVFQMDRDNYEEAFNFMKEIAREGYTDVATIESFSGYRHVPVDSLTRDLIVAVLGDFPVLQLSDETGHSPRTEKLIGSKSSLVTRIVGPHKGEYKATVRCQGVTSVTIYSRMEFPLKIGFSPLYPTSIKETAPSPLPGRESFILVLVPNSYEYKLSTITIHFFNKDSQKTLDLMESSVSSRVYISQAYFEPRSIFRMTVNGMDSTSSEPMQIISKTIESQREVTNLPWSAAVIENIIPETSLINYKENATVACKVTGCPQPSIWWESADGQKISAEESILMYPATYISYVKIPSLADNQTITCKASTASGSDSRSTQLYVYRPYVFEMIRKPEDTTIEYEADGKIYCEVNAYPEAQIRWYHNDKAIVFTTNEADDGDFKSDEMEYFQEANALFIRNMSSKYVGKYTCDVRNDANVLPLSAEVRISGLESPVLEMPETQLTSRLGEGVKIECRVSKGRPKPIVTWKFKPVDAYEFTNLSEDVEVEEGLIKINEVMSKHKGTYKCEAVNEQGENSQEVDLKVIYAPQIENADTSTKEVLLDKQVTLECSVDADPKATVYWERSDGVQFPDEKHVVDGNHLKFVARYNDSGSYRCVAQNEAGTAEKMTNVYVLVRPYITPVTRNLTVRAGSPLTLSCHVQEAVPPPTITWKFRDLDSKSKVLFEGESMFSSEHVISRATRAHAGTYLCLVENRAGRDFVEITVHVK